MCQALPSLPPSPVPPSLSRAPCPAPPCFTPAPCTHARRTYDGAPAFSMLLPDQYHALKRLQQEKELMLMEQALATLT